MDPYLFMDPPTLTGPEVASKAGIEYENARKLWIALGLPDVDENTVAFDEADVEALRTMMEVSQAGFSLEDLTAAARVYGQSIARVADADSRLFGRALIKPHIESGESQEALETRLKLVVPTLLDLSGKMLDYVHRRHLEIALQELSIDPAQGDTLELATGFVDLVDFSRLSDELRDADLAELLSRFEEASIRITTAVGVRLVKILGDAVMFVTADVDKALETGLALIHEICDSDLLPLARGGIDFGSVLPQDGDYFGRPVNVAARIIAVARPETLVVSEAVLDASSQTYDTSKIGTRKLKGVGPVVLFKVRGPTSKIA